jgi:cob(I)alamin adenosyltransferase
MSDDDRHREKMAKRKAVQDAEVASKKIEKGLLIVHTGPGKGKTTAALGLVLRMLGRGHRVGVVQFIKGAWDTGEAHALQRFGDQIAWHALGEGFTWETQDKARDIAACRNAWETARALMADESIRLLVLDELNIALRYDYLDLDAVVADLRARRPDLHVVVTGGRRSRHRDGQREAPFLRGGEGAGGNRVLTIPACPAGPVRRNRPRKAARRIRPAPLGALPASRRDTAPVGKAPLGGRSALGAVHSGRTIGCSTTGRPASGTGGAPLATAMNLPPCIMCRRPLRADLRRTGSLRRTPL